MRLVDREAMQHISSKVQRQDTLLTETINRIHKHLNLGPRQHYTKPFIVLVSKADLLRSSLDFRSKPWSFNRAAGGYGLDLDCIFDVSFRVRELLHEHAPEIVHAVEGFADHVLYMPVSSLGHQPHRDGINQSDISPQWVEIPLLYLLYTRGLIPAHTNPEGARRLSGEKGLDSRFFFADIFETEGMVPVQLPSVFIDKVIRHPTSGEKLILSTG
jgi:hypothetical protein